MKHRHLALDWPLDLWQLLEPNHHLSQQSEARLVWSIEMTTTK
jgi:hypothetical protein